MTLPLFVICPNSIVSISDSYFRSIKSQNPSEDIHPSPNHFSLNFEDIQIKDIGLWVSGEKIDETNLQENRITDQGT